MTGCGRGATTLFVVALVAAPLASEQALTFDQVADERRLHSTEVEAQILLAEARGAALGAGSVLLEGPTASASTGPRRTESGVTETDVAVDFELPLLSGRNGRAGLAAALGKVGDALRASSGALALADLSVAYAEAWLAQAELDLRQQDVSLTEAWLASTQRRVDAGADPPYESILVAGERDRALLDLLSARSDVEVTWGELARLAVVDAEPRPLDLETLPGATEAAGGRQAGSGGAALAGIEARRELTILLARARSAAASSRWVLAGDVEREGEERVAHLGVAYRFPLQGERAVITEAQRAAEQVADAGAAAEAGSVRLAWPLRK